jgi:hypothetical protein
LPQFHSLTFYIQQYGNSNTCYYFADGKLIFELSHRKEGERTAWIPVPKKTFWPPSGGGGASVPAMAIAGTSRQEGSTSLSGKIV